MDTYAKELTHFGLCNLQTCSHSTFCESCVQGLQNCPICDNVITSWKCCQSTMFHNKLNPLVMSFAPIMQEITNDVPILGTTPKEKYAIEMETKDGIQDQDHEDVDFKVETNSDEEASTHVKWHSKQFDLVGEKENQHWTMC